MKKTAYLISLIICTACLATSCDDDNEVPVVEQSLALTASSTEIQLDENSLDKPAVTFTWTETTNRGEGFTTSYLFKMDKEGNEFKTAIPTIDLGEGVLSKSLTNGELQNLLIEKWKCPDDVASRLEVRVIGRFDGPHFIKPEVSTITIAVKPFTPKIIEAKKVFMQGSALPGEPIEITQTYEDEDLFAYKGDLKAGELSFKAEMLDGTTRMLEPLEGENTAINDGGSVDVWAYDPETTERSSWIIPEDGSYRIIFNKRNKKLTVYSEKTDIKLIEVAPSTLTDTPAPVTEMYIFGEISGWAWTDDWKFEMQSQADPNVWIWTSEKKGIRGQTKFGVIKNNESYVFSADPASPGALDVGGAPVTMGVPMTITGGLTLDQRNSYFQIPASTNVIVLNLTDMTVTFKK